MNIVYFTSGISGMGRVVRGVAIGHALQRSNINCTYSIISSSPHAGLFKEVHHRHVPPESEQQLSSNNFHHSELYKAILETNPDILLVDLMWFAIYHFINRLDCTKIFLTRQTAPSFFSMNTIANNIKFDARQYNRVVAIENYDCPITKDSINPIVIRNRDEILSHEEACRRLNLKMGKKHCLFSLNLEEKKFREIAATYSYLEDEGYDIFHTSLFSNGIFPIADYFNAFDLIICGGGYNAFWEAVYFKKEAVFIPVPTRFESQQWRIDNCQDYIFKRNGADELVEMIFGM